MIPAGNSQQATAACTKHETIGRMLWTDWPVMDQYFSLYLSLEKLFQLQGQPQSLSHHCSSTSRAARTQLASGSALIPPAASEQPETDKSALGQVPHPTCTT